MSSEDIHLHLHSPKPFTPTSPFLRLPAELRMRIYDYALDWPDMQQPFARVQKQCTTLEQLWVTCQRPRCVFLRPRIQRVTTPTILLLNRQIYHEAITVLLNKTLVLMSPPPHSSQLGRVLDITDFIGEATLQNVAHVVLKMNLGVDAWLKTIERLLDVWCKKNRLKSLHVGLEGGSVSNLSSRTVVARASSPIRLSPRAT
ncbi:hypothetical protein MMC07_007059 [Pseudocyphellaria aurata]|nr:hypothetical protein [Pseudocyphellaria aurata]